MSPRQPRKPRQQAPDRPSVDSTPLLDLQGVLNAAKPGRPLPLKPGVYEGDARLRVPRVRIYAPDGGVEIRGGRDGLRIMPEASDTVLDGLLFRGAEQYNLFAGAHGLEVHRCRFSEAGKSNLLKAARVAHVWLHRSVFNNAKDTFDPGKGGHGAYLGGGGDDLVAEECDFLMNAALGLHLNACPGMSRLVVVRRCSFSGNKSAAVQFSGIFTAVVEECRLFGNRRDFVIHRDLDRPQCSNADLDFLNQYGKFQWHDDQAHGLWLGPGMVKVP